MAPAKPGELDLFGGSPRLFSRHKAANRTRRRLGERVLAYVLRPRTYYVYEPSMVCVAAKQAVPSDVVFVAYVRLDEPFGTGFPLNKGVLTHWQFVEADSDGQVLLPVEFQTRYHKRMW